MKKFLAVLLSVFCIFLCGCATPTDPNEGGNGNGNTPVEPEPEYGYVSMLSDKTYKNGFLMRGLGNPIYGDDIEVWGQNLGHSTDPNVKFQYEKEGLPDPEWHLCQWATRYPFHDINNESPYLEDGKFDYEFTDLGNEKYQYLNTSKSLVVDTNTGEYSLGLKASECFKEPRKEKQEWPHWFTERYIGNATNPTIQTSIAQSQSIKVQFDIRLNSFEDKMNGQADPNLHSALCVFYLFVANFNPDTKAFDDMLWFGLTPFDNRYVLSPMQSFPDVGSKESATDKWIYNIAGSAYFTPDYNLKTFDNKPILNEWRSVDVDVLPYIRSAFEEAQRNGYMEDSKWENLYVNGMYFGYETPGTYDIDMSFKNVDIVTYIPIEQ